MRIPFSRAPLTWEKAAPFLKRAIDNGWLTTGPLVQEFTAGLANFLETENVVPLSSCTAALQIALTAADLKPGDEVILPSNTFIATLETAELHGLTPRLADIDSETWNMSLESAEKLMTDRTRAIVAVPFAGNALPMEKLRALANRHRLTLILDCAHALETRYAGKPLHAYADFSCYSFYATKNLTTAEGGAIVCSSDRIERVRALSLHGMSRAAWNRYAGGTWRYDIVETGFKANLTDIHAGIGLAQLADLSQNHTRRLELAARYEQALKNLPVRMQKLADDNTNPSEHARHLFCISIDKDARADRDTVINAFREKSIGYSVHFIPLYEFSNVKKLHGFEDVDFPHNAEYFAGALSLPLYPTLTNTEQDEIISLLQASLAYAAAM
jgi:dTDP-4-amino-4,6-dideoxygalactose transaminase